LRGVAAPLELVEEGVSLQAEQVARDNPERRRAPPDRVVLRRTVAPAKVCKDARVDRVPAARV
jgi:hypothetical protein